MPLDPEVMKQLLATFQTELEERLQTITDGLLTLEKTHNKKGDSQKIIEAIFRAAHNIKGSARGIGIQTIGEIVHHIESIFAAIKEKKSSVSPELINLCLTSVDSIRLAMEAHCNNKPLAFDLEALLKALEQESSTTRPSKKKPPKTQLQVQAPLDQGLKIAPPPSLPSDSPSERNVLDTSEYETIRVPLYQIEIVSALIEQMQINKIGIEENYSSLIKLSALGKQFSRLHGSDHEALTEMNYLLHKMCKAMHASVNELGSITNALQDELRMLRLVPASTLLRHLTRSVRSLGQELNKQIEFEISGDQVKLDKLILEGLKDPIMHLLRNSIDHGIENPEIRKKQGKPEFGKISIDVLDEGNQILINISDDGSGIDYTKVAETAIKRKIMTQAEIDNMKDDVILDLIFRPEFSTKEIITSVSGRGVGLDVVKSNISDLKGTVTFTTKPGKGTCFHLHLPLTLSSDIGLTIKSGGQLFVIPVSAIERVMMLHTNEIHEVEASQVILLEKKPIPLYTLSDILDLERYELALRDWLPIVIIKKGWDKVAFLVEEIIGERDIVIKPLQPPLMNISCVAGGTLSGTGEIIIVLNAGDLIQGALRTGRVNRVTLQTETLIKEPSRHHILLAEDSITTRTLEKNILENSNYKVTAAVDGKEAWELLQKQDFSLVITDIEMPNMNGFELTERIKQSEKYQDIPVIIVTSLDSESQKSRGIEVGANAYIVKHDFESTELLEIVRQLV